MPTPGGRRILIADDSADLRAVLRRFLEAHEWHVEEAVDGADAIHLLAENTPVAMILDLQMPGIGGEEVIDMMLRGDAPLVPTVVLSGFPRRFEGLPPWLPCVRKGDSFNDVDRALRHAIESFEAEDVRMCLEMQDQLTKMREKVKNALQIRRSHL